MPDQKCVTLTPLTTSSNRSGIDSVNNQLCLYDEAFIRIHGQNSDNFQDAGKGSVRITLLQNILQFSLSTSSSNILTFVLHDILYSKPLISRISLSFISYSSKLL